jgi:integrase
MKNFNRQHRDAVHRIGLPHQKMQGTTEHGHRHSYGYRLAGAGFNIVTIQKAMHHKSPESPKVYMEPTDEDIREEFAQAERRQKFHSFNAENDSKK